MPRKDLNQIAFDAVQLLTGQVVPEPIDAKKQAAIESGRKGGLKGGKARTDALTAPQRKEIAQKAAKARWNKKK